MFYVTNKKHPSTAYRFETEEAAQEFVRFLYDNGGKPAISTVIDRKVKYIIDIFEEDN